MSSQRGGTRGDELGVMVPFGGSSGAKELLRLPHGIEKDNPAAALFIRGRIGDRVLAGYYGLAASLAGNHAGSQRFFACFTAASLGINGLARNEYMMDDTGMLVPSAMARTSRFGSAYEHGQERPQGKNGKDRKREDAE